MFWVTVKMCIDIGPLFSLCGYPLCSGAGTKKPLNRRVQRRRSLCRVVLSLNKEVGIVLSENLRAAPLPPYWRVNVFCSSENSRERAPLLFWSYLPTSFDSSSDSTRSKSSVFQ